MNDSEVVSCSFVLSNEPTVAFSGELEVTFPEKASGGGPEKFVCRGKVVQVETSRHDGKTGVICAIDQYQMVTAEGLAR
jgi:hypothetical protein